jgi:hypothetical protein
LFIAYVQSIAPFIVDRSGGLLGASWR